MREVQNRDQKKVGFGPSWEGVRRVPVSAGTLFSLSHPCLFWRNLWNNFRINLDKKESSRPKETEEKYSWFYERQENLINYISFIGELR